MVDEFLLVGSDYQVVTSTLVFLIGYLIVILQPWFRIGIAFTTLLYAWHTLGSIYYAYWTLSNTADAKGYYNRSLTLPNDFSFGTAAIDYITAIFTQGLGLSYLGTYLFFNIIGTLGLITFFAALQEVTENKDRFAKMVSVGIVFLPGANFWTGMIGKDALTLFATALLAWGTLKLHNRYCAIVVAAAIYLCARPYMVGVIIFSFFCGWISESRVSFLAKLVIGSLGAMFSILAIQFSASVLGLGDGGFFGSISDLVQYQQLVNQGTSSVSLTDMNIVSRLFAYLFRPFFIDAIGMLGLIASVENLFLFGICLSGLYFCTYTRSSLPRITRVFFVVYGFSVWFVMSNTIANTGLALRQKWMCLPIILLLALSYFPIKKFHLASTATEAVRSS